MEKKYIVRLTDEERLFLQKLISSGTSRARKQMRARILLKADQSEGRAWETDSVIAKAVSVASTTVEQIRRRFVETGFPQCLDSAPRPDVAKTRLIHGAVEAKLIAVACSTPPLGRARWTLRRLADRLVELDYVEAISTETVRKSLKKTNLSLG